MATFLANEIKVNKYYRERHTGPTTPVQIVFLLKDKKNAGEDIFSWTQMNKQ